ncbi:MAG: VOC family protein [Chloroflexia bacterium]|nr:VOC family protein [Chloroflexia bacterium]
MSNVTTTEKQSGIDPLVTSIGMHEMVLEVADLDAAERFYREVIGLPVAARWTGERPAVWLDLGDGAALGLWPVATGGAAAIHGGRGGSHVHFALRIPHGSLEAVRTRLEGHGYDIEQVDFEDGNRSLYLDDPDGNVVELMEAVVDWAGRPIAPSPGRGS